MHHNSELRNSSTTSRYPASCVRKSHVRPPIDGSRQACVDTPFKSAMAVCHGPFPAFIQINLGASPDFLQFLAVNASICEHSTTMLCTGRPVGGLPRARVPVWGLRLERSDTPSNGIEVHLNNIRVTVSRHRLTGGAKCRVRQAASEVPYPCTRSTGTHITSHLSTAASQSQILPMSYLNKSSLSLRHYLLGEQLLRRQQQGSSSV
jgi:hypothetical protein